MHGRIPWLLRRSATRRWRLISRLLAIALSLLLALPLRPASAALPVVTLSGTGVTYNEGVGNMTIDPGLLVSDADAADTIQSATVTLRVYITGQDTLGTTGMPGGLTFSFDAANGEATIIGSATPAVYTTALRSVYFANSSTSPNVTARPVDIQVRDSGAAAAPSGNSVVVTRTITMLANPSSPTIAGLVNSSTPEDTPKVAPFTLVDLDTPISSLTVTAASSNPVLVPNVAANLAFGGGGADPDRTLTVTPAANQTGTAAITITVNDGASSTSSTFTLTVDPINDAPTTGAIAAQSTPASTSLTAPFTVADPDGVADIVTITATSANAALVPNANLTVGGTGTTRTLTITPTAGLTGTSTITVIVTDTGSLTAVVNFVLTVSAGTSQAPTIAPIAPQATAEDTPIAVNVTVADADTPLTSLTLNAISSNPTVVTNAGIVAAGTGATRVLTITPVANQLTPVGSPVTITVTVSDGALTGSAAFLLSVGAVDDPPTLTAIPNQTVAINRTTAPIRTVVGDSDTPVTSLVLSATSSNTTLAPNVPASFSFFGTGADRALTVTPAPNETGTTTIEVGVTDGTTTTFVTFTLTVTGGVGPQISAMAAQTTTRNVVAGPMPFSVSDADTPVSQITVSASSSNAQLAPSVNITVQGTGVVRTVTVTPASNEVGSTTITLAASDGTNAGFASFQLTVTPSAPTVTANSALALGKGDTATITPALLQVTDPDTAPANLVFTVVSPPTAGTLRKNGAATTSFSQADLDAGRMSYANSGGAPSTDSFNFSVTDGTTTVQQTFGIVLSASVSGCTPRSPVRVRTRALGGGRLEATITATDLDAPLSNRLRTIRIGNAVNARVFIGGAQVAAGSAVDLPTGTVETVVILERINATQATTVPLVVRGTCGEWPTFVGGGPGSF